MVNIIRRNCRNRYMGAVVFPSRKIVVCTSYFFFSFRLNSVALQLLVSEIDRGGGDSLVSKSAMFERSPFALRNPGETRPIPTS